MIRKLFKKAQNNETFGLELTKKAFDTQWLKECLESKSVTINFQEKNGDTFLISAIKNGKYQAAQWLIENGADISIKNNDKKNALDVAVDKNNLAVVKGLLETKKIDPNQKDASQRSLLQNIVVQGNFQMAKVLLQHGADINTQDKYGRIVLYDALVYGDQHFLRYLLSLDKLNINHIDQEGNSLLHYQEAAQSDSIAKDIIIAGIDTTITKGEEDSYFYKTMVRDDKYSQEIFELALSHGANVNAVAISGNTLMMELIFIASQLLPSEIKKRELYLQRVTMMLEYHGDISALNHEGETALFNAVRLRDQPLVEFLVQAHINTNIQNKKGQTVLEDLLYDGIEYIKMINLLLEFGIDPKLKNKKGQCSFEIIIDIILHNAKKLLIDDKEIVQRIDPDGFYMDLIKHLINYENNQLKEENGYILDVLDSGGNPLFFKPLMNDHFALFNLFTKYKVDIHKLNKSKHNIFYAYVLKIFEEDVSTPAVCKTFQENVSSLISRKIDRHFKDSLGWTILHKITSTQCNLKLFNLLISSVRFDFSTKDNLGRTVIHNAVWHNQGEVIKLVNSKAPKVIDIEDNYNIPPIYYAALLGNGLLVSIFFELGASVISSRGIDEKAKKKFKPMLKNFEKLLKEAKDDATRDRFKSLILEMTKKFNS